MPTNSLPMQNTQQETPHLVPEQPAPSSQRQVSRRPRGAGTLSLQAGRTHLSSVSTGQLTGGVAGLFGVHSYNSQQVDPLAPVSFLESKTYFSTRKGAR